MAREIRFTGPEPEPGMQLCMLCTMIFKGKVIAADLVKLRIKAAQEADTGPVETIDLKLAAVTAGISEPQHAVGLGLTAELASVMGAPLAMVPLCWSHLQGATFTNLALASGQLPSGQPVPLLDGSRSRG